MKRIILLTVTAVLAAALLWQEAAYENPFRLHVIANSDSAEDQSVKLEVRDAVLEEAKEVFTGTFSLDEAKRLAELNEKRFEQAANAVLRNKGMKYSCSVETGRFSFPEKDYEGLIYPAGEYPALRVVLGEGEGQNWWCVMYPPLCITGRRGGRRVILKSALVEWIRSMKW